MLPAIIALFCLYQGVLTLPQPDHHPAAVYDANEHRLYLDFPPEIFIGNGTATVCPISPIPIAQPCICDSLTSLMCSVGQQCIPRQGSMPPSCVVSAPLPACIITPSYSMQANAGIPCQCGTQMCSSDQYCDMSFTCIQVSSICTAALPLTTPCKCGVANFCLGMATMCMPATSMCT